MGLFQLRNNQVIVDPSALNIPEFMEIWKGDKSKTKDSAHKALSFIYYMVDFNSPYSNIPAHKRIDVLMEDFIKEKKWKITPEIQAAMDKYQMLSETPALRLVMATRRMLDKLGDYIDESKPNDKTIRTILATIEKVAGVLGAYTKMEETAQKEQKESGRTLGNRDVGVFER